jgi:hypothetical protein
MNTLSITGGVLRYEFLMQIRRRSIWFVLALVCALSGLLWLVFTSGSEIGSTLATLAPVVILYIAGAISILARFHNPHDLLLALEAFAAIPLPGMLFAAGFSLALPAFLKVPLYQILFIGYWFWANLTSPRFKIPTPTGTMLNATGPWAQEAFFHYPWVFLRLNLTILQGQAMVVRGPNHAEVLGVVQLGTTPAETLARRAVIVNIFFAAIFIGLFLCTPLGGWYLARNALRPLRLAFQRQRRRTPARAHASGRGRCGAAGGYLDRSGLHG